MGHIKTLHVVGFKNSGKTTLVARWVRLLKDKGYRVATLKQHRHDGRLKMPDKQTDSMQFFLHGADSSIVTGGGTVQVMLQEHADYYRLREIAKVSNPHIILVEGFKEELGEKVVLVRAEEDWEQLQSLQGIQLVVGCPSLHVPYRHIHHRTEEQALDEWLLSWLQNG